MMRNEILFNLSLAACLAGTLCVTAASAAFASPKAADAAADQRRDQGPGWRDIATDQDRLRIRGWRSTWMEGLRAARRDHAAEIARAGALLDPDSALLRPEPPAGEYRCRTIKIGSQSDGMLDWIAYPDFRCRVRRRGGVLTFTRMDGSQRPIGRIYPDGPRRMIFLGSMQLGDERQVLPYGTDSQRDMAGILERVGERQWRLVFPRPAFESIIDVVELVPAG
ncbi:MAG TPA: DUF4893 domain-containing protein [Allosphingosinicella sp.]